MQYIIGIPVIAMDGIHISHFKTEDEISSFFPKLRLWKPWGHLSAWFRWEINKLDLVKVARQFSLSNFPPRKFNLAWLEKSKWIRHDFASLSTFETVWQFNNQVSKSIKQERRWIKVMLSLLSHVFGIRCRFNGKSVWNGEWHELQQKRD